MRSRESVRVRVCLLNDAIPSSKPRGASVIKLTVCLFVLSPLEVASLPPGVRVCDKQTKSQSPAFLDKDRSLFPSILWICVIQV